MSSIDLNADLGEECGDDIAMLDIVTTVNVAAGGHAGGGAVLESTVRAAAARAVAVGAHPSYVDHADFGRVSRLGDHDVDSLTAMVRSQVLEVMHACARAATRMTHVKAHGALYHDIAGDRTAAEAFLAAVIEASHQSSGTVSVMGPPTGELRASADRRGVHYITEAFADRAYLPDGRLVPRSSPEAVLESSDSVVAQAMSITMEHRVRTATGGVIPLDAQTLCVHGDTPGAVRLARDIREALEEAGVRVARTVPA